MASPLATTGPVVELGLNFESRERSEEHTSELQSQSNIVCRLLLAKKNAWSAVCASLPAIGFATSVSTVVVIVAHHFAAARLNESSIPGDMTSLRLRLSTNELTMQG